MKTILFVGDSHGKFDKFNAAVSSALTELKSRNVKVDEVVSVGDFGFWPRARLVPNYKRPDSIDVPVLFIDGNHEDHKILAETKFPNDEWDCSHIKRGTFEDGILYMGGATSIDKSQRIPGWDWFEEENISYRDFYHAVGELEAASKACALICAHDTIIDAYPQLINSNKSPGEKINDPNAQALLELVKIARPKTYVHGHHHTFSRYDALGTHFVSLDRCDRKDVNFTQCTCAITNDGTVINW
jgi:hypothetical protein